MAKRYKLKPSSEESSDMIGDESLMDVDTTDEPVDSSNEEPTVFDTAKETSEIEDPKPSPFRKSGVPFSVFQQISGLKPHLLAGFKAYAQAQKLGPLTIKEWREAHQAFLTLPVR